MLVEHVGVLQCTVSGLESQSLTINSARRIKCDESKEFCNNCVSTGRVCDGYRLLKADAHKISSRPLLPAPKALTSLDAPNFLEDDHASHGYSKFIRHET